MKCAGLMLTVWLCTLLGATISSQHDDISSVSRNLSSTNTEQKERRNHRDLTIKVVVSEHEEKESILNKSPLALTRSVDVHLQERKTGSSCFEDSDCLVSETCVEGVCVDPCKVAGMCGLNTVCQTDNHRAACTCLSGYGHGDPRSGCMKNDNSCFEDSDCLVSQTCVEGVCVDPCKVAGMCGLNTVCQTDNHRAACTCLSGYVHGHPRSGCMKNDTVNQVSVAQTTEEDISNNEPLTTSMRSEENNPLMDKTETADIAPLTVTDTAQVSAAAGHGVGELMAEQNTTTPPALRKMYVIRTEKVNWEAAENKCKADNMTLASIRNIEEQHEFNNTVSRQGLTGPNSSLICWLGAKHLDGNDVVWVDDHSRLSYTHWAFNEPDSVNGYHCAYTFTTGLWWRLGHCSTEHGYVCEYYI